MSLYWSVELFFEQQRQRAYSCRERRQRIGLLTLHINMFVRVCAPRLGQMCSFDEYETGASSLYAMRLPRPRLQAHSPLGGSCGARARAQAVRVASKASEGARLSVVESSHR